MEKVSITRRSFSFGALATGALVASGVGSLRAGAQSLADRKITFGIHNQNPWGYRNADGSISGIHPDMVRAILEPLGIKNIEFAIIEFGALIPSLISKRIDAVASGLAITPQRCEQVVFTNPDVAVGDGVIVKKGNLRWSRFPRQGHKVDLPMKRTIQHEDTQTVYGRVQGQSCA